MGNGIIKVHIHNFKSINDLEAQLDGNSVFLIGDNEVGKSSFMQAIFSLLSNEDIPAKAVTQGQTEGVVSVDFQVEGKKYTATRKFTEANPKGYFEIETEDGMKTNKVTYLEHLIGEISFNPFEFVQWGQTAEGRKKQAQFIRKLIPEAIRNEMAKTDADFKQKFESRTFVNRDLGALRGQVQGIEIPDPETYGNRVEVTKLVNELSSAHAHNRRIDDLKTKKQQHENRVTSWNKDITKLEKELAAAKKERDKDATIINAITDELGTLTPTETAPLQKQIEESDEHNRKHDALQKYYELLGKVEEKEKLQADHNKELEALTRKKAKLVVEAKLPIEGLSINEDSIYLKGLPLEETQIPTSVIMDLGVRIAVALNPRLRILSIPRGESLGSKRMEELIAFAQQHGYQLFIEKVESGVDKLKIQFIEHD